MITAWRAFVPTLGATGQGALVALGRGWWRMTVLLGIVAAFSATLLVLSTPLLRISTAVVPAPTSDAGETIAATYYVILASVINWIVSAPALVLGPAASIVVASDVLADRELNIRRELRQIASRSLAALGAFLLVFFALIGTILVTTPLIWFAFFLTPIGLLLLALYAFVPRLHRRWLFWTGLVLVPFALPSYLTVRWSLVLVAVVADGAGPRDGLARSWALTAGRWLEVFVMIGIGALAAAALDVVLVSGAIGLAGISADSPGLAGTLAQGAWIIGGALVAGVPFALLTAYYVQLSGATVAPRAARRRAARGR